MNKRRRPAPSISRAECIAHHKRMEETGRKLLEQLPRKSESHKLLKKTQAMVEATAYYLVHSAVIPNGGVKVGDLVRPCRNETRVEAERDAERARHISAARALDTVTKERDAAREQLTAEREAGRQEAREGIAELMAKCESKARRHDTHYAVGQVSAYANAAAIARNWQPAQEGGAK